MAIPDALVVTAHSGIRAEPLALSLQIDKAVVCWGRIGTGIASRAAARCAL